MPVNWYAGLVLIVILGLGSVFYARYENQHSTAAASVPPTTTDTWYSAFGYDLCGTVQPAPAANTNSAQVGIYTTGKGLITIAPKNSSEEGTNAVLGKFVSNYPGNEMALSQTGIRAPGTQTFTNGEACPKGTPDAGKTGQVVVRYWTGPFATLKSGTIVSGNPSDLRLANGQLITMAFLPSGKAVPKPPAEALTALLPALNGQTQTTTTLPGTIPTITPTTAASGATTTVPTTTPTTAATNTTKPPGTTTTAKK